MQILRIGKGKIENHVLKRMKVKKLHSLLEKRIREMVSKLVDKYLD